MGSTYELAVIGGGNMAEGIVGNLIRTGVYPAEGIAVTDPQAERRELLATRFGVQTGIDNAAAIRDATRVLLAIKPQVFGQLAPSLAPALRDDHLVISIMAGISTAKLEAALLPSRPKLVRVMPNLPVLVGAGGAGLFAGPRAGEQDVAEVRALFDAGGQSVLLADEGLMDAVTAVSGSGPAYFYYLVEAMVEGGVACGLAREQALKLAECTCLGAARMMLETGEDPAELRRKVTSKGGTTQAAIECLERNGAAAAIRDAVAAAFNRGRELGR